MKKDISNLLILVLLSILFCQCKQTQRARVDAVQGPQTMKEDETRYIDITQENKQVWEEANKVRDSITESTFLKQDSL